MNVAAGRQIAVTEVNRLRAMTFHQLLELPQSRRFLATSPSGRTFRVEIWVDDGEAGTEWEPGMVYSGVTVKGGFLRRLRPYRETFALDVDGNGFPEEGPVTPRTRAGEVKKDILSVLALPLIALAALIFIPLGLLYRWASDDEDEPEP